MWPRSNLHSRPEISGDPYKICVTDDNRVISCGGAAARERAPITRVARVPDCRRSIKMSPLCQLEMHCPGVTHKR